jgi:hypothetical protein
MQSSPHKGLVPSVLYLLGLGVSPMLWIVQYGKKYDFNLPFRFRVAQASAVQVEGIIAASSGAWFRIILHGANLLNSRVYIEHS